MPRRKLNVSELVDDPNDPLGMAVLLQRYLEWMRTRNYSENTVLNFQGTLARFIVWAEERGVPRPREVTKPIVERYQRFLFHLRKPNGDPLSFRTQAGCLTALRSWFKWLSRNNHVLYNPASDLDMPKLGRRLPKHVLTVNEAEQIIALPDVNTNGGIRDRAILETLYSTGIRRMEIINLSLYDVDHDRGTIMVREGKGKKDRMVPIGERALAWIERYVKEVRPLLEAGDTEGHTLFLTDLGKRFRKDEMTAQVRQYVVAADVGKRGACHLWRHTAATVLHDAGADIRFIQAFLGHARLQTTEIYTQVSIRQLKAIHSACHPSSKVKRPDKPKSEEPPRPDAAGAVEYARFMDVREDERTINQDTHALNERGLHVATIEALFMVSVTTASGPRRFLAANSRRRAERPRRRFHRGLWAVKREVHRGCGDRRRESAAALLVDPMGFDAGDSNLYRYVNNAPTDGVDPSGMEDTQLAPAQYWQSTPLNEYKEFTFEDLKKNFSYKIEKVEKDETSHTYEVKINVSGSAGYKAKFVGFVRDGKLSIEATSTWKWVTSSEVKKTVGDTIESSKEYKIVAKYQKIETQPMNWNVHTLDTGKINNYQNLEDAKKGELGPTKVFISGTQYGLSFWDILSNAAASETGTEDIIARPGYKITYGDLNSLQKANIPALFSYVKTDEYAVMVKGIDGKFEQFTGWTKSLEALELIIDADAVSIGLGRMLR